MTRVLERSTRLLDALASRPLWTLAELAAASDLPPATCARLLTSLVELGWADQISPRGAYRLGPRVHALAEHRPYLDHLLNRARPVLDALVRELHQAAVLVRLHGEYRQVMLMRFPRGFEPLRPPAEKQHLYDTATGRLLLAHLPSRRRRQWIDRLGLPGPAWPTVIDRQELLQALRELRRHKIAEHQDRHWHSCAIWIGEWDGEGACIGTFAQPGQLHPDSQRRLIEVRERLALPGTAATRTSTISAGCSAAAMA